MKKIQYVSIIFSILLITGCENVKNNHMDINSSKSQDTNSSNASKAIITIDGKQVNLGEIPLPTKQPNQFTITPKLLYALGYEVSSGNEFLITFTNIDVELVEETISDIKLKTGIKNIEFKTLNRHLDSINNVSVCNIVIYPKSNEEAVRIADYGISQNSYFKAGLAQVNIEKYYPELSEQEFQEFMQGNLKPQLTISTQELFDNSFQYKIIIDRLNQCLGEMKTLDGILECYSDKDGNYYQDKDMVSDLYMLEQNEPNLSSNERHKIVEKQILDEMRAKEANGAYKGKFNNFQTTYKKLFGSEYVK